MSNVSERSAGTTAANNNNHNNAGFAPSVAGSAASTTATKRLRMEFMNQHMFQQSLVTQQNTSLPLDDLVLLKLLVRSILYDAPWEKPHDERLAEGTYNALQKLEIAKRMVPLIDEETFNAVVTVVREEDPIVSLKVLYAEADSFKNLQMAPPDPFYDGANWKDGELRAKRLKTFYATAQERIRHRFKDDSIRKEDSWKVWNMVQSGEAMRRPPDRKDLIMPGESLLPTGVNASSEPVYERNPNQDDEEVLKRYNTLVGRAVGGSRGAASSASPLAEPDGQFVGGQLHSCFGGVLIIRIHALRYHGKTKDPKVVSSLPSRLNGGFVFCINTRPQSLENELSTCANRSFIVPHSVTDYDAELLDDLALPEFHLGEAAERRKLEREKRLANGIEKSNGAANDGFDMLPEIDETIPVRDVRAPDHFSNVNKANRNMVMSTGSGKFTNAASNKKKNQNDDNNNDDQQQQGAGGEGSEEGKRDSTATFYWDFRDEYVTLDLGAAPIRVDFSELVINFRTPPTCCGVFGVKEICDVRVPMSALYIHILALNSINRRKHFGAGEEGVHSVHKWFECTPSEKLNSAVEENGTFSVCLSMHLACRSRAHNKPMFPNWNPFTDPQFDINKGTCKILTNVPAMQQIWKEPLHRYFISLIENFNSRLDDIEVSIIENFHDLFILDPQLLFIWTFRTQLFSGKLFSVEDRSNIRLAASHLAGLLASKDKLYTYTAEKLALDTKKHTINRFLALPGSLEEIFSEDDRILHANDGLNLAVVVLQNFQFNDLESSVAEAAKRDVAAFFVVALDTMAEIATRFGKHCQEVLKDFTLCFQHMKKAITFGLKVKKLEDRKKNQALAQNHQNLTGNRLTASKVITIRMQVMAEEVCKRLRTAINHIHIVGASSDTKSRPEAISPLMQLMQSATDCADQLAQYDLKDVAHELEGIVPQTFLPMFLSLKRESLRGTIDNICRSFPLEPSKPGRVYSTPAASDAFQFIRATFDDFCECARSCDVETVLICLGSLMNYMIEALDVFLTAMKDWAEECVNDVNNPFNTKLAKSDTIAGPCLAKFQKEKITFERTLSLHATLNSFSRLLVDFWDDQSTVDFIQNLEAAVSHVGDDGAGSDSEHQVFQAKASMMQAINSAIFELEIAMVDRVVPTALQLPIEYVLWSRNNPVKNEDEMYDHQRDIAGATANCMRQIFFAIMHRADREILRDRLCHVAVRSIVTNLINTLVLNGNIMTAPEEQDLQLKLQRGLLSAVVHVTREEIINLCDAAGESVLATTSSMLYELDTALAIGLMTSFQLVSTLDDLVNQIEEMAKNGISAKDSPTTSKPATHKRQGSQPVTMKISKEKYEKLLRKACVARAKAGEENCQEYCVRKEIKEYISTLSKEDQQAAERKDKKKDKKK